jgi:uncharacterized protein YfaS (alpha-2-macroglobulin family)
VGNAQAQNTQKNKAKWRHIDSLMIAKGAYTAAQQQIEALGKQAWQQKDYPQWLKAFMHTLKVNKRLESEERDAFVKNIVFTQQTLPKAPTPAAKAILHSILADLYRQYLDFFQYRTRYGYSKYTKDSTSIEYWTDAKIRREMIEQCRSALKDEKLLQKTSTQGYRVILQGNDKNRKYRPTLYDLLAHQIIQTIGMSQYYRYFMYGKIFKKKALIYSPPKVFAQLKFQQDSSAQTRQIFVLNLWQRLTQFHLASDNQEALADITLQRIKHLHKNSILTDTDPFYLEALRRFEQRYSKYPISTQATYLIADHYYIKGRDYKRGQKVFPQYRLLLKKAYQIAQTGAAKFNQGLGKAQNEALMDLILKKDLEIQMESVVAPKQPLIVSVQYQNIPKLYWRVLKLDAPQLTQLKSYTDKQRKEKVAYLLSLKTYRSWSTTLPDISDYQPYRVEERVKALPTGRYVLLTSVQANFTPKNNLMTYQTFAVSSIAYIQRKLKNNQQVFYTVNRHSGKPLANVKASLFVVKQDKKTKKQSYQKLKTYKSNAKGRIVMDLTKFDQTTTFVRFSKGKDYLETPHHNQHVYLDIYPVKDKNKDQLTTHFFLDRKIYRPGQTVHFKGVVSCINVHKQKYQVAQPHWATVLLYARGKLVRRKHLEVNKFGSFSGTFVLPKNGVTGYYRLEYELNPRPVKVGEDSKMHQSHEECRRTSIVNKSFVDFVVEEYKRPKFSLSYAPLKKSYKLGQTIALQGKAKAYSGANIQGAKVKYSIKRDAYYIDEPYGYFETKEVATGDTITNVQGEFWVKWQALPDSTLKVKPTLAFTFSIMAEVTDINGETQQKSYRVKVGYSDLVLETTVAATIDPRLPATAQLKATNLNGQALVNQGTITIYRLKVPKKYTKERNWEQPDQFNYSQSQWAAMFPHAPYDVNKPMKAWKKLEVVQQQRYKLDPKNPANNRLVLKNTKWQAGQYMLVMRADGGLETSSCFTVQATNSTRVIIPKVDYFEPVKTEAKVGESAQIWLGSSKRTWVLVSVLHQDSIVSQEWKLLNKKRVLWQIPIEPKHRGNFSVQAVFVRDNRCYQHTQLITVPFANKKLDIRFETFRNKLLPGEKEKWRIKIKGAHNTKIAAEMLATLYDASLDAFGANQFSFDPFPYFPQLPASWNTSQSFAKHQYFEHYNSINLFSGYHYRNYETINWFGYHLSEGFERLIYTQGTKKTVTNIKTWLRVPYIEQPEVISVPNEEMIEINLSSDFNNIPPPPTSLSFSVTPITGLAYVNPENLVIKPSKKIRTNFNETAFFYPHLRTDAEGSILVEFTVPESLTRWRMLGFAHTKDLKNGLISNSLVTQKELMIVPNAPRFFRESDQMTLSAKVSNISDKNLKGNSQLQLFDALTNQPIEAKVLQSKAVIGFEAKAGQSTVVSWQLKIPVGVQAITYRITATAGNFSDGEEMTLPVLTNRVLITESLPLAVKAGETKTFVFKNLQNSRQSTTLRHHQFTLEFTPNPVWYAIQALPYLMEFPHECAEQTFSRVYANALAAQVLRSNPKIKQVFEVWKTHQPEALMSNLDKNPELKSMLVSETPWVLRGKTEASRKRRLGLLFDLNHMANEQARAFDKLGKMQTKEGAFPWFGGMQPSRYISQHIVGGLAHLEHLGVKLTNTRAMALKGLNYLDKKALEDYQRLLKQVRQDSAAYISQRKRLKVPQAQIKLWAGKLYKKYLQQPHLSQLLIQYLYVRSFYPKVALSATKQQALDFYMDQAQRYWQRYSIQTQGMIALVMHRAGRQAVAKTIVASLKQRSTYAPSKGRYWQLRPSHYWYHAPVETQAMMVEVFEEVIQDQQTVEELKIWLLNQKQTQRWATTKATTEACYALLMRGKKWLAEDNLVEITIGQERIRTNNESSVTKTEAGSGYFKKRWKAEAIDADMGNIKVAHQGNTPAWGAVYWQYFEQLDKVKRATSSLKLSKRLWLKTQSPKGEKWVPITATTPLKVGDLLRVKLKISSEQAMSYVHLKDMRASALEPLNVLSSYKYHDGLGYYESTRDAATHFFIDYLPQGKHTIQYELRVTHAGNFSDGISTIESMYAPQFRSHSAGKRVRVK